MKKPIFWEKGIRFECQGSGGCCVSRGEYGFVYLSLKDRQRFAQFFNITTTMFTQRYCTKTDGWFHLNEFTNQCQFLKENRCTVYSARPNQCRTWPFWPENMNVKTWNKEIASYCPGVGKGKLYTKEEIEEQLALDPIQ
jgi:Fe-S-cluster containining protein